jgi:hypothetical protein
MEGPRLVQVGTITGNRSIGSAVPQREALTATPFVIGHPIFGTPTVKDIA